MHAGLSSCQHFDLLHIYIQPDPISCCHQDLQFWCPRVSSPVAGDWTFQHTYNLRTHQTLQSLAFRPTSPTAHASPFMCSYLNPLALRPVVSSLVIVTEISVAGQSFQLLAPFSHSSSSLIDRDPSLFLWILWPFPYTSHSHFLYKSTSIF